MRLLKLAIRGGALAVALQISAASQATAHPHVWITTEVEVLYNQDKAITGFLEKWTFDEMYTAFAIQGLDKNKEGKYDRNELQELAKVNINALKEFQYFTYPKINENIIKSLQPENYWMEHNGSRISLNFTLTLAEPIPYDKMTNFSFAVYDPTDGDQVRMDGAFFRVGIDGKADAGDITVCTDSSGSVASRPYSPRGETRYFR